MSDISFVRKVWWALSQTFLGVRATIFPRIKRHPYITVFIVVMLIISVSSFLSPEPDICSPQSISAEYDEAVSSICASGLDKTTIKNAIEFAQDTSLTGKSVYDTAEILKIESDLLARGLTIQTVQGITLQQIQGGAALTTMESADVAKQEIANTVKMALRFAQARDYAKLPSNVEAFSDVLFKIREASADSGWYGEFLDQLDSFPPKAFADLSIDGLQNIAALDMSNPVDMSTVTEFMNSPAYTDPSSVFCSPPKLREKLKLGLCVKGKK